MTLQSHEQLTQLVTHPLWTNGAHKLPGVADWADAQVGVLR